MSMLACPSCGGPFPTGRRCCPHCHCRYPLLKRWKLLVTAALGLTGCLGDSDAHGFDIGAEVEYGPVMLQSDLSATPDLGTKD